MLKRKTKIGFILSNGYSPANLANSSTRQKFAFFGEFEYSPKRPFSEICETRQTRRHLPSRVARTCQTCRDSPSHVARTRQAHQHSPSRVAQTRQTCERRVWQVLRKFSESGESGKFGECRLDHFMHKKYVICVKNNLSYHARLRKHSPRGLASTRQTRRHSPSRVARTRQTRRHSPNRVAGTHQTRQHSPSHLPSTRQTRRHLPKAISGKNVTRLDTFARVICHSREFGASGHCLLYSLISTIVVNDLRGIKECEFWFN